MVKLVHELEFLFPDRPCVRFDQVEDFTHHKTRLLEFTIGGFRRCLMARYVRQRTHSEQPHIRVLSFSLMAPGSQEITPEELRAYVLDGSRSPAIEGLLPSA